MHKFGRNVALLALLAGLFACKQPSGPTAAQNQEQPAEKAPVAAPALPDGTLDLEGILTYTPLPATMSVEAYMGVEHTLTDAKGGKHVLGASEDVTSEALRAQDGERVRVRCVMQEPTAPSPHEAYPTGPNGEPLKRPAKCRVLTLTTP